MNNDNIDKLTKKELQQLLKALDPEKTVLRIPQTEEADDEPIEKQPSKPPVTDAPAEEVKPVDLTARGTPRKRILTERQLATVRANAQSRHNAAEKKKEAERLLLEKLKKEEQDKLEKKLRQRAKVEVASSVTEAVNPEKTVPSTITLSTPAKIITSRPNVAPATVAKPSAPQPTKVLTMQDYLRQYGL